MKTNDEWLETSIDYMVDVVTRHALGIPLTHPEQRIIDVVSARIGVRPESPTAFAVRMLRKTGGPIRDVATVVRHLPYGTTTTEGVWD